MKAYISTLAGVKKVDMSTELLFVYGTLKIGGKNHKKLGSARLLGIGATLEKFEFHQTPFAPTVVKPLWSPGVYIPGELYEIERSTLCRVIDPFEKRYKRVRTRVVESDGAEFNCWIYLYKYPTIARLWTFFSMLSQ
jgi:gamma-glutamylcyclotransferase (GGCT)/AIG2-like uncharacterized protein YtfP